MAITPNGKTAYFVRATSPLLTTVNVFTRRRTSVILGPNLSDVAVSPNGSLVYITAQGSNGQYPSRVYVVDAATDRLMHTIRDGASSDLVAFSPKGGEAYIVQDQDLLVIDVTTSRVVARIPTGAGGGGVEAVSPNGRFVYLASNPYYGSRPVPSHFRIVNVAERRVIASTTQGLAGDPCAIAVNPNGKAAYESFCLLARGARRASKTIRVLNPTTGAVESRFPILGLGLAVSPNSKELIVADFHLATLHVFNLADKREIASLPVAGYWSGILLYQLWVGPTGTIYAPSYDYLFPRGRLFLIRLPPSIHF